MKKIVYILEASTGGTRRHVVQSLLHLDTSRFELVLIAADERDPHFAADIQRLREQGVVVELVPMGRHIHLRKDYKTYCQISALLRQMKPDVVYTHSSKAGVLGRLAARALRPECAVIHSAHCFAFEMDGGMGKRWFYQVVEWLLKNHTDRLLAIGQREAMLAHRLLGYAPEKIQLVNNGIDVAQWQQSADGRAKLREQWGVNASDVVVGAIGRLTRQKGCDLLLSAVLPLLRENKKYHLVFVGNGQDYKRLVRQVEQAQLEGQVHFIHSLGADAVKDCYDALDICALPSRWEACPYVLLEAMAKGLPVLATDVGDVKQMMSLADGGLAGVLVPRNDALALNRGLASLFESASLRSRLGSKASDHAAKQPSLTDMVDALGEVFDSTNSGEKCRNLPLS